MSFLQPSSSTYGSGVTPLPLVADKVGNVIYGNFTNNSSEYVPEPRAPESLELAPDRTDSEAHDPSVDTIVSSANASRLLREQVLQLLKSGRDETFEDGIMTTFSRSLVKLVRQTGEPVVYAFALAIDTDKGDHEVIAEALRWLGKMTHQSTKDARLWLLEHFLFSDVPQIRDGATLGLSFMNDPSALEYLRDAVNRERVEELREDMAQVLEQLTRTAQGA